MQSAWGTLLQDIELMPQDQDFRFQPPSWLEAVAQHTDEEEGNCDHQPQPCSDSIAAVTPVDGVFGSDRQTTVLRSRLAPQQTVEYLGALGRWKPERQSA
jgi:hypothetical protein